MDSAEERDAICYFCADWMTLCEMAIIFWQYYQVCNFCIVCFSNCSSKFLSWGSRWGHIAADKGLNIFVGVAVNHDGRSNGFTAPSRQAQEKVIATALQKANLLPHQIGYLFVFAIFFEFKAVTHVSYLEAHGTGTPIGDPIEMAAAGAVLGVGRSKEHPLFVSSVKANILKL